MASQERYQARLAEGLCASCGARPHEPDRTKCETCLDVSRDMSAQRREYAREHGTCVACFRKPVVEGRGGRCDPCADKYMETKRQKRSNR